MNQQTINSVAKSPLDGLGFGDEVETEKLIQNEIKKQHGSYGLFGMDNNYTMREILSNFINCGGLQIRKYKRGRVESPIFRLVYIVFLIFVVFSQIFLRGWCIFLMVIGSENTNVGFWIFYLTYTLVSVIFAVFAILSLIIHETRMMFLGLTLCMSTLSCIFGVGEIVILAFVVDSGTWILIVVTVIGNLCAVCWFWVPVLYLIDLIRVVIMKPRRRKHRRLTDM